MDQVSKEIENGEWIWKMLKRVVMHGAVVSTIKVRVEARCS